MDLQQMKSVIEGLLFVAGEEGLTVRQLVDVLERDADVVADVLMALKTELKKQRRGVQLVEMAGVFQLTTLPEHAAWVQRLAVSPARATLSQASLETLAIIAYKQPITRMEIEEIRGVKAERALQNLMLRQLIHETGRAEQPGRPILYGTTKLFLDHFALKALDELPESSAFILDDGEDEERLLFDKKLQAKQITIEEMTEPAVPVHETERAPVEPPF